MNATDQALLFNGITPPDAGSRKTLCPKCSHTRKKFDQKCLSIKVEGDIVSWLCFHCKDDGSDII